jgi:hypothetical protein
MEEKPSILHRSVFSNFRSVLFRQKTPSLVDFFGDSRHLPLPVLKEYSSRYNNLSFFEDAFVGLPIA